MHTLQLTDKELETGITQLKIRLNQLEEYMYSENKKSNFVRVVEIENIMQPIRSLYSKMVELKNT